MIATRSGATGFVRGVIENAAEVDIAGLSAELAYRLFLAIFPFFIFLSALGGWVAANFPSEDPAQRIVDTLGDILPADAASLLESELRRVVTTQNPGLLSLGLFGAVFFATGATNTLIKAINRVHRVEETRPIWRRYPIAIGITVLAGICSVLAFVIFFAGQAAGSEVAASLGIEGLFWTVLEYARWPLTFLLIVLSASFLYWATPNDDGSFRWVTPGALLFGAGWLIGTSIFGYYVGTLGSYAATYGALAGVAILLLWFYLTSFIFLLGAVLNATIEARTVSGPRSAVSQ